MRYLILSLVVSILASCSHKKTTDSPPSNLPEVGVKTVTVQMKVIPVFAEVVGTVVPRRQAEVTAKVTGRILEMNVVPGSRVKKGDLLATLSVGELDASLNRAEAALAQANRELDRYKNLLAGNAATRAEFEQAEAQQRMAAATVEEVRAMVGNASITAPFDGTVTRKLMEPGDLASPARPLCELEDSSLLRLRIDVAESLAGRVRIGDRFRVKVEGAGADFEGQVMEIAPSADVGSRTFSIKLDLPENKTLRAGQFGRAFLPRGERAALRVPTAAVIRRGQMDYLFIAEAGKARLRIVRTGGAMKSETEIIAGLDEGEIVISNPPTELREGQALIVE